MKYVYVIILSFVIILISQAQSNNLVINYSFESKDTCPYEIEHYPIGTILPNWTEANYGTPDYFNACSIVPESSTPFNAFNFQLPHDGFGYVGIGLYLDGGVQSREYIQGTLKYTLINGNKYIISFYVNKENVNKQYCIDNLGVFFSDTLQRSATNFSRIPVTPQFNNPVGNYITHLKNGWHKIEGTFIASGGEKYFTIGNFDIQANIHKQDCYSNGIPANGSVYIFIDDVSVIDTSLVDTIQLCVNDSVLLGGSYRNTEGLYIDTIQGLYVRSYLKPSTNPAYHIDIDLPFNGRDSVYVGYFWFDKKNMHTSDTTIVLNLPSVTGCDSIVYFHCRNNVGIDELNAFTNGGISIYPNPISEYIHIKISAIAYQTSNDIQLEIYDAVGRSIKYEVMSSKTSNEYIEYKLNLRELSSGMYFIQAINKENRIVGNARFICQP